MSLDDIIRVEDQFYILATASAAEDRARVLKHGETFAVFDRYGDIRPLGLGEQGIYHEGTRFVSRFELRLGKNRPLLLSSTVKSDNTLLAVDLTNPDFDIDGDVVIPRGTVHIFRSKFLLRGACYERLKIWNHGLLSLNLSLFLRYEADFSDIFEVRGLKRARRGRRLENRVEKGSVFLPYEGLDGVVRRTKLDCSPTPNEISDSEMRFDILAEPKSAMTFFLTISCELGKNNVRPVSYDKAFKEAERVLHSTDHQFCTIHTSNEQFNDWLNRSVSDLQMMITDSPKGPYPYAGVPWFSTIFGRDGIITALEFLWVNPAVARGVLAHLADKQAKEVIPEQDAEPGKILHESRRGELAALGEVPFGLYYGSVDATPLFIVLAGAYYERTGDRAFIESIWPNVELALEWISQYGDSDRDGFVEYLKRSSKGLIHQGWKDSKDSVFHADGSLAEGPLALCEVQGYVYAAKQSAAALAYVLGQTKKAEELCRQAQELREQFERSFWSEELSTYVLALDGDKLPCKVQASNAGHALFTGVATPERARLAAQTLLGDDSFSGWGIRTVAASEVRYNPMSYHNGSVWPHDNALIAYGLAQYGFQDKATKILAGLFDASLFVDIHRMPELFCGFPRRPGEGPTLYPVACAPQSWAAAAVFLLLQACLGLTINAPMRKIHFSYPFLPEFLQQVQIRDLKVGSTSVDLLLDRHEQDVGIKILRKEGDVEVVLVK